MDVSFLRLLVVEPADEEHFFAEISERREHFAEFHLFALAPGPPFFRMKTVAGEQYREADRRFAGGLDAGLT